MTKLADLNIREGSNKEKVAIVFLKAQDRDAAVKKGLSLDLQESTVRTWCSQWSKGGVKKVAKKAGAKKTVAKKASAKKAAPKKAAAAAAKPAPKKAAKKAVKRETLDAGAPA